MPARRPFFRPLSSIPDLVKTASKHTARPVFAYSLAGGWPSSNSALRLLASLGAVLSSFSFAFIASLATQRFARRVFAVCLSLVALLAAVAACLDIAMIVKVARECSKEECTTLVPDEVMKSSNVCRCGVDAWFYFTVAVDLMLFGTALVCLALTVVPMIKRRGVDPSRTTS